MTNLSMTDRSCPARGRLFVVVRHRGVIVERFLGRNLVVAGASNAMSHLVGGSTSGNSVTQIGFGTNGTAPVSGNTGLTGAYTKAIDSVTYPSAGLVQFNFSLGTSEANGIAIFEFGLFTAAGALFARRVRASAALAKDSDISLTGNWQIQF